jgi:Family of unknown function (DUF6152)
MPKREASRRNAGSMHPAAGAILILAALPLTTSSALAHHSYVMFDHSKTAVAHGIVAQLEWTNPHAFVWIYVKRLPRSGYDLYAFETASINRLVRFGWSKGVINAGQEVAVEYYPLKDGRTGGYLIKLVRADGSVLKGDPDAPGVRAELAKGSLDKQAAP